MLPLIHGFIKINNFKHKKKTFSVVYVRYYNTICTPVKLCNDGERGCAMYVCMLYRTRYKGGGVFRKMMHRGLRPNN